MQFIFALYKKYCRNWQFEENYLIDNQPDTNILSFITYNVPVTIFLHILQASHGLPHPTHTKCKIYTEQSAPWFPKLFLKK